MMMNTKKQNSQLIIALDINSLAEVRSIVTKLSSVVDIFKVGSQLFTSCGPAAVRFIEAQGKKVFLDLKYHDIPNTVANAVEAAISLSVAIERSMHYYSRQRAKILGLFMLTVHTSGGQAMMEAAVQASMKAAQRIGVPKPLMVGVTVLTSEERNDNILPLVMERAHLAKKFGLDGVVASAQETKFIRQEFGKDFIIVTPGIRLPDENTADQKRVATPDEAIQNGSDYLVVGRSVIKAKDPFGAVKKILDKMNSVK